MKFTLEFFALLSYTAMITVFPCKADPPPTGLAYKWLDHFTLQLSWEKPRGLPDDSETKFLLKIADKDVIKDWTSPVCTSERNFNHSYLTEEMGSDHWTYNIWTLSKECNLSNESPYANITVKTRKPRAELVKDFKCLVYPNEMKCSWIPTDRSLNLTLSYRTCGRLEEEIKGLKVCSERYSVGGRDGCDLINTTPDNQICILLDTEAGMSTFKPVLMVPPPKMSITEEGDYLRVNCTPPEYGNKACWKYKVCYKQCNMSMQCSNNRTPTMKVAYVKSCFYEFQSKVETDKSCINMSSNFSAYYTYGTNVPPDRTLTVVAIVIPIILSICVILSCYCFKRHSAIICPVIPDPSALFKEMMMNGSKELYTPVPEPIEPCKVTVVTENSDL